MEVPPVVINIVFGLFIFLLGVLQVVCLGWISTSNRATDLRLKKLEDWKVDKGAFQQNKELVAEKFNGVERRIADLKDVNTRDHGKIEESLLIVNETLSEVRDCMIKLATSQKC